MENKTHTVRDDEGNLHSIKVGDYASFKSDYEQSGIITAICGTRLTLAATDDCGFGGGYIGGQDTTVVRASDCWFD